MMRSLDRMTNMSLNALSILLSHLLSQDFYPAIMIYSVINRVSLWHIS